jgi:hypothetical protein
MSLLARVGKNEVLSSAELFDKTFAILWLEQSFICWLYIAKKLLKI